MHLFAVLVVFATDIQHATAKPLYTPSRPSGYVGCFKDGSPRILPHKLNNSHVNTGDNCKTRCKTEGYRYAGTEVGIECFCGHLLCNRETAPSCDNRCRGNQSEFCGGYWKISVYDTWPVSSSTQRNDVTCMTTDKSAGTKQTERQTTITDAGKHSSDRHGTSDLSSSMATTNANLRGSTGNPTHQTTYVSGGYMTTNSSYQNSPVSVSSSTQRNDVTGVTSDQSAVTNQTERPTAVTVAGKHSSDRHGTSDLSSNNATTNATSMGSIENPTYQTMYESNGNMTTNSNYQNSTVSDWTTALNNTQFRVIETKQTCSAAREYCTNSSASLVTYISPLQYISLPSIIVLETRSYWIGACAEECIILTKNTNHVQIQQAHCDGKHPFICSRIANISKVTDDPEFVELLKNMTVNKKKTKLADRKLTSADDRRLSSKVVGGGIGIFVFCFFISFVLILDINTCKKCCLHS